MNTYLPAEIVRKIYQSKLSLVTSDTLQTILSPESKRHLFRLIGKLIADNILVKIERDKYLIVDNKPHTFEIANFLYQPSYISFETALNQYGILPQFPYEVTSTTVKNSKAKSFQDVTYSYIKIKKHLYWGFTKELNYLIAEPEKALLDQAYLASKGLRSFPADELDISLINQSKLRKYLSKFGSAKTTQGMQKLLDNIVHL
jgi:predicted transcriptional regulator of viral defense system